MAKIPKSLKKRKKISEGGWGFVESINTRQFHGSSEKEQIIKQVNVNLWFAKVTSTLFKAIKMTSINRLLSLRLYNVNLPLKTM